VDIFDSLIEVRIQACVLGRPFQITGS